MDIYPAIDIRRGRVVRLSQGEAARETVYADDPLAQAERFLESGARWLHVVDLDRAFGDGSNVAYRARCRPPSLIHFALFPHLIRGHTLSDVVAVLGSLNIIAAELDR